MVGRSDGFYVLYPVYFDGRATRAAGRRVTAVSATPSPDSKDIFEAAKAAGMAPVLEDEHHHPSAWYERTGRVLVPVDKVKSKHEAILRVAKEIKAAVAKRPARPERRHERPSKNRSRPKGQRRRRR